MRENETVIAWDGEGWGKPKHVYGLLANSVGDLLISDNLNHSLHTLDILDLLWRTGVANPDAYMVTYGGTYDWNHWISDINKPTAIALHEKFPIRLKPFEVSFNGMWFEVSKNGFKVTIWDVWRFWGCPFAQAVKETWPDFHGLRKIEEFKAYRNEFQKLVDNGRLDEIIEYNNLELEALVGLVLRMFKHFEEAKIRRPSALTGAGAVAGSLLIQHQVAKYNDKLPDGVYQAALRANFGGRIEAWKYGVSPPGSKFYSHDIRSAYPFALRFLPALTGGKWEHCDKDKIEDDWNQRFSLWHIEWDYYNSKNKKPTDRGFPFAFRDKGGSVLFPTTGRGWHWWPEVITARNMGFDFKITEGYIFTPLIPTLPFAWMDTRYEQRRRLKRDGFEGASRLLKYGINATWGKTAQARGYTEDHPPRHHNIAWAGWVTSHCRATIFDGAMQDPDSVVYMMTDSLGTTKRLNLPEGDALGQWEIKEYPYAMVLQAGVSFLWDDSGKRVDKFRGFDKDSIDPKYILRKWRDNIEDNERHPLLVPASRPVTLGSALSSDDWFEKWNTWQDHSRELDLYGGDGKRWAPNWRKQKPWLRFEELKPWGFLTLEDEIESAPFEPKWEGMESKDRHTIEGVLRDIVDDEIQAGALA